jgi:hypothetical protein
MDTWLLYLAAFGSLMGAAGLVFAWRERRQSRRA